jgi:glucose-1-phosphate adenylyltransferase
VGERAVVPDGCQIGKNVVIDAYLTSEEYSSLNIESGKSALKGGKNE